MKSWDEILFMGGRFVTPSVLHYKPFAKTCHEHHVYVCNACDKVCRSISITRNDQLKCETKVDSIVVLYHLGFKINFY